MLKKEYLLEKNDDFLKLENHISLINGLI